MASKGQKFKKTSSRIKEQILKDYDEGKGGTIILGKKYGISYHTIDNWIAKRRKGIDVTIDHHKGNVGRRKSTNLTIDDYKERYEILKKYQAFLEARQEKK